MTYSHGVPGLAMADHHIDVPLNHDDPTAARITVFAREVRATETEADDLPWLLYLQGGPGGRSPRPTTRSGWLAEAVGRYRVLLLDQRGTGRSTPVTPASVGAFADVDAFAAYLRHFRADAVVRDAEVLRAEVGGGRPWTTLGQSYGGFCTFAYLSTAPEGLERCLVTGGIPPIGASAGDVYRSTWPRVIARNREYARRYPEDQAILDRLRGAVTTTETLLPTGEPLTLARLRALGIAFGTSTGFAEVHYLLEDAFAGDRVSATFLAEVAQRTSLLGNPLYAVLQEAIYCEGTASGWAAARTRADYPELAAGATPVLLTGETMEPSAFTDETALRPLLDVADRLHAIADWPQLYNPDVLSRNDTPVAAAVYYDDMYVGLDRSMRVASEIPRVRTWVTNEHDHDGLRADAQVFTRLHDLATGRT